MVRCRNKVCKFFKWKLGRAWSSKFLTYIIIFAIICTNFTVVLVFSATRSLDLENNISGLLKRDLRQKAESPTTLRSLNNLIANATGKGLEDTISVKVLLKLLEQFKDQEGEIRQSYIDAVMLHNNLTIDVKWRLYCHTLKPLTNSISELYQGPKTNLNNYSDGNRVTDSSTTHRVTDSSSESHISITRRHNSVHNTLPLKDISIKLKSTQEQYKSTLSSPAKTRVAIGKKSPLGQTRDVHVESSANVILTNTSNGIIANTSRIISCIDYTTGLADKIQPMMQEKSPQELAVMFSMLQTGGHFTPKNCSSKENTAIIIPYRNRYSHLHILLLNIVPLLIKQNVEFTIFVVEQELPGTFNRGMLFNIGFLEALKMKRFDCFIFHDVDLIPINELNFYHCNDQPTHFVAGVNKFKYKPLYKNMFGGVVAFTQQQFKDVNGASNLYFGWGGEDDDLRRRVEQKGFNITRKYSTIGLYDMIKHTRDKTNNINPVRKQMLKLGKNNEGLNTTIYTRHSVELLPLYTWVKVTINMTDVLQTAPNEMNEMRKKLLKHFSHD